TPEVVEDLLQDNSWYRLYAPDASMALGDLSKLALWQEMAAALLRKYCEMFYGFRRKQWEADKLEYKSITDDSKYLFGITEQSPYGSYTLTLDSLRHESLIKQFDDVRQLILEGKHTAWHERVIDGLELLYCERHLYQPLVAATQGLDFQVSPVALNMGERHFVKDLQSAWNAGVFNGYELFMLRNQTGQGAVGVFIDGGFQPDFILWLKGASKEHIVFVDPKGLRHHTPNSPKVQFHKTVKELQQKLAEQDARNAHIRMDAFLISNTPKATLM